MTYYDETYLARRLAIVRRAQGLSPSMGYDLATSPLSTPELEDAVSQFDPKPRTQGWGFADVFDELLSQEPKRIPVSDISQLQSNLKDQGYLDPDFEPTGIYDSSTRAAFGQFERDNQEAVRQGNHLLAAPVQDGFKLLGMTVPTSIVQGVIGAAKGLVQQAPETFERAGALGGAGIGLGLAAAAAPLTGGLSLVGAGVAAGIGAGVGFLSDLLGHDDEESENSFMDALTPFNSGEWTKPANLFEDLGFVATAASLLRGGAGAVSGAAAGSEAAAALGKTFLAPVGQPGWVARLASSAKGGALLGGIAGAGTELARGQDFGDVLQGGAEGALLGGAAGKYLGPGINSAASRYGLSRLATNPMLQTVNKVYTGLTTANVGARLTAGIGGKEDEEKALGTVKDREGTTIAEAIESGPKLPDWVDWAGSIFLFPERFFPVNLGEIGGAFRKSLGNVDAYPYIHALGTGVKEGRAWVEKHLDPVTDYYLRRDYGKYRKAVESVENMGQLSHEEAATAFVKARSDIERGIRDADDETKLLLERDLLSYSYADALDDTKGPMAYAGWLKRNETFGGGLDRLPAFKQALPRAEELTLQARAGDLPFTVKTLKGEAKAGTTVRVTTEDAANLELRIADLQDDIKTIKRKRFTDPEAKALQTQQIQARSKEVSALRKELEATKRTVVKQREVTFVPARQDYLTETDLLERSREYDRLLAERKRAQDAFNKSVDTPQGADALDKARLADRRYQEFVRANYSELNLNWKDDVLARALNPVKSDDRKLLTEVFTARAKTAGKEVVLPPDMLAPFADNGYKLVSVGEDMAFMSQMQAAAAMHDVGGYTKRANLFESIGVSPFAHSDDSIRPLRRAHEEAEMQTALEEAGIKMNGRQAMDKIRDWLTEHNHGEGVQTFGPFISEGKDIALRKRIHLYKIDPRQLSLDNIIGALGLDGVNAVDDAYRAAAGIKGALQRGAAMGGEVSLRPWGETVRSLALNMRVNGLQGFSDWMRTFHVNNPARAGAIVGGIAGAGIGEAKQDGWDDIASNAIIGALGGAALGSLTSGFKGKGFGWPAKSPFKPGQYGYLTDKLHNANMALRYSLSFTFDAGRYSEQAMIAAQKYDLPAVFRHKSYISRRYAEKYGSGEKAWKEALDTLDDAFGNTWMRSVDDIDRRMFQRGMLGFSPREADAAYALMLRDVKGFNPKQIKEAIQNISRYGPGRTGAEKSVNFVFFPFSFSKKLIGTLGDWALQEPARAFLIHESMRHIQQSSADEKFGEYVERYVPLLPQLKKINNLAYGLSPGRFFLEGFSDNKTMLGKVTQALSSVFVPSGAATPIAQGLGRSADFATSIFAPVVLVGEDIDNFIDAFDSYFPMWRDAQQYVGAAGDQITAIGEGGTPYYQLRGFLDEKNQVKAGYQDLATSLGYSSVEGFFASDQGAAFKDEYDQQVLATARNYPTGVKLAGQFEQSAMIDDLAIQDLANDPNRSVGEEMILQLVEMQQSARDLAPVLGVSTDEALRMFAPDIREVAVRFAGDRRFAELYERFLEPIFGPIRRTAA